MPSDLTIFAASYLVYIEAIIALAVVALALYREPPLAALRWLIAAGITVVLAEVFAQIGGALYNDPRPFAVDHVKPLIAHARDNGFPSDHALLAASLVVFVLLVRVWPAVPLVALLALLVDWARVGAGIHHPIDVIGSTLFVAVAALIAVAAAPFIAERIIPYLPAFVAGTEPLSARLGSSTGSRTSRTGPPD